MSQPSHSLLGFRRILGVVLVTIFPYGLLFLQSFLPIIM